MHHAHRPLAVLLGLGLTSAAPAHDHHAAAQPVAHHAGAPGGPHVAAPFGPHVAAPISGMPTASGVAGGAVVGGGGGGGAFNFNYNPGIFFGYGGGGGGFVYSPPVFVVGPGGFFPNQQMNVPQPLPFPNAAGGGLMLPLPPGGLVETPAPRTRRSNPARAREMVEIGDRSFRAGNIHRAEEKYNLAVKADPSAPSPHVHLAQVSMARGDYSAAADHLRDAVTVAVDGAWLLNAPDIQAIFGEPGDFARQLARLETHLQANPNDRDGWFVLGAESYLSGRSRQAFDLFQRLTDRQPDEALAAFLDASKPKPPPAN